MKHIPITLILSAIFGLAGSTSCSTTKGFGQDLQKVGNRLENSADATGGTAPPPSTGLTSPAPTEGVPSAY